MQVDVPNRSPHEARTPGAWLFPAPTFALTFALPGAGCASGDLPLEAVDPGAVPEHPTYQRAFSIIDCGRAHLWNRREASISSEVDHVLGLFVQQGLQHGLFFPLDPARREYTIGRDPSSSLVLDDEGVSRNHAKVVHRDGRWYLRDAGSRNGTYLNSLRVEEKPIALRDLIHLGLVELLVVEREVESAPGGESHTGDFGTVSLTAAPSRSILGKSRAIRALTSTVERVAAANAPVLVLGETGTGKEMVARVIHTSSPRRNRPFVALNCGSIPEHLVESEFFGHESGAFTGALAQRVGRFEEASGGTILLDEVGDLPLSAQTSLLRVLQERTIRRVGGEADIRVDVRVIAATHRDLESAVSQGRFREDLYHRLRVVELRVPALRERTEDIPILVERFLGEIAAEMGMPPISIDEEAIAMLRAYPWPGNVRELRNALERAVILSRSEKMTPVVLRAIGIGSAAPRANPQDAPSVPPNEAPGASSALLPGETLDAHLARMEEAVVREALARENWNQTAAARRLGISEGKIRKSMRRYGIERPS
jgi:DNA-binding NtrC family response regulator